MRRNMSFTKRRLIMGDVCGDNRFEIIAKAKADLLNSTNIDTSEDEIKVIDSFLFRCWQMGWLERYEEKWIKIDRDKWGFLADGMLEQMYGSLPIIVWDSKYEMAEYMDEHNWGDWLSSLEGKPYYSHYMQIVSPPMEEEV